MDCNSLSDSLITKLDFIFTTFMTFFYLIHRQCTPLLFFLISNPSTSCLIGRETAVYVKQHIVPKPTIYYMYYAVLWWYRNKFAIFLLGEVLASPGSSKWNTLIFNPHQVLQSSVQAPFQFCNQGGAPCATVCNTTASPFTFDLQLGHKTLELFTSKFHLICVLSVCLRCGAEYVCTAAFHVYCISGTPDPSAADAQYFYFCRIPEHDASIEPDSAQSRQEVIHLNNIKTPPFLYSFGWEH